MRYFEIQPKIFNWRFKVDQNVRGRLKINQKFRTHTTKDT